MPRKIVKKITKKSDEEEIQKVLEEQETGKERNGFLKKNLEILGMFSPKKVNYMPFLIVLLAIMAFAIGSLYTQVQYLQKANLNAQAVPSQANAQNQPNPSGPPQKVNVGVGHLPVKGDLNAKVTIVEFADLRCPFCKQFFTQVESQLMQEYVNTGKVKFYFRHYDFLGPASTVAADAAECANDQGKFWEFHDYMYQNQPSESDTSMYTTDNLTQIAGTLGMNTTQFQSCLATKQDDKKVTEDFTAGNQAGVSGTPTIFIDGTPIVGSQPYPQFKAAIDAELSKN